MKYEYQNLHYRWLQVFNLMKIFKTIVAYIIIHYENLNIVER